MPTLQECKDLYNAFLEEENRAEKQALNTVMDPDALKRKEDHVLVKVYMDKLSQMTDIPTSASEMTRIDDPNFVTKFDRFADFAEKTNEPIRAPYQVGGKMGINNITMEGNHRLAYFLDEGVKVIQVALRKDDLDTAKKAGLLVGE
jgi:hypothetical protein